MDLNDVIQTVGRVIDGVYTLYTQESRFTIACEGYETINVIGSPPERHYEPYTPQFVDL